MTSRIDYGNMMHRAMRSLISDVLAQVAVGGLPGAHHFFITFDTRAPGVGLSDWLRTRYPEEMTIVLQHWFEDLDVGPDGFAVTLNFGDHPERLEIPFDAIRTFVDPSVEFGLRFESNDRDEDDEDADEAADEAEDDGPDDDGPGGGARGDAEVVRLDRFRK